MLSTFQGQFPEIAENDVSAGTAFDLKCNTELVEDARWIYQLERILEIIENNELIYRVSQN